MADHLPRPGRRRALQLAAPGPPPARAALRGSSPLSDRRDDRALDAALVRRASSIRIRSAPAASAATAAFGGAVARAHRAGAEVVGDRDALEAELVAQQPGRDRLGERPGRDRVVGGVEARATAPRPGSRSAKRGLRTARVAGLERRRDRARPSPARGRCPREAAPRPGEVQGRAGDARGAAAADRRGGQLAVERRVVGEGAVGDRAVERGDVGDRDEVEVEPGAAQRLAGIASPSPRRPVGERASPISSSVCARAAGRRSARYGPPSCDGDDQRRDPAAARARRPAAPRPAPRPWSGRSSCRRRRGRRRAGGRGPRRGTGPMASVPVEAEQQHLVGELAGRMSPRRPASADRPAGARRRVARSRSPRG